MMTDKVRHAPYAIIRDLGIYYGKTTKTACGKRRKTSDLVPRSQTKCPDCKAQIALDHKEADKILAAARELGFNG
jgi:hypothetical protein